MIMFKETAVKLRSIPLRLQVHYMTVDVHLLGRLASASQQILDQTSFAKFCLVQYVGLLPQNMQVLHRYTVGY